MVRKAAPPQLSRTQQNTSSLLPSAPAWGVRSATTHPAQHRAPHSCHASYTSRESHTTVTHPRGDPHRTVTRPIQQGTPTQPPGFSESPYTGSCGWGGGASHPLGPSLPTPTSPAKQVDWAVGGQRKRGLGCPGHPSNLWSFRELFTGKDCFSPTPRHVPRLPRRGPRRARTHRTPHRAAGGESCRNSPALTAARSRRRRAADQSRAK